MTRFLAAILVCAAAQAATVTTTISINGSGGTSGGSVAATGNVTFTGGFTGTGTFSSTFSLTDPTVLQGTIPITITVTTGSITGKLTGTFSAAPSLLLLVIEGSPSASGPGTIAITSGTGGLAGTTGSFSVTASGTGLGTTGSGAGTFTLAGTGTLNLSGGTGSTVPTISVVWDAGSNTPNMAPGTIFVIKGSNILPGSTLTAFSVPRPTTSPDGVTVTFTPTAGGTGTKALLWYEDPKDANLPAGVQQLAGIVPSSVTPGNYNVTVTNGSQTSAPFATQVVASKFTLFTQDSTGGGLAVAQRIVTATQYDLNRLTTGILNGVTFAPGHPGENMVAYGTGLGAAAGLDNAASPVYDFSKNGVSIQAVVGGMSIPVQFAGLAGYAGEDQINFQLPSNVPTGCAVTFQISVNGTLSPATTLSIAPNGAATACVYPGLTTTQLTSLDNGGTITTGGFQISQLSFAASGIGTVKSDSASGAFSQVTAFQLGSLSSAQGSFSQTQIGSCTVLQATIQNGQVVASGTVTNLDAGAVTLSGPSGTKLSNTAFTESSNAYSLSIGTEGVTIPGGLNGSILPGTYTIAAAGGTGVKNFSTSITMGAPLAINGGLPSTVNRSQPLALAWTGGNSTDVVTIYGYSGTTTGSGTSAVSNVTSFTCLTTAGTGGFTVSTSVLGQLMATPSSASNGTGFLEVVSGPPAVSFSPSLVAGGTVAATLTATSGTGATVTYQ